METRDVDNDSGFLYGTNRFLGKSAIVPEARTTRQNRRINLEQTERFSDSPRRRQIVRVADVSRSYSVRFSRRKTAFTTRKNAGVLVRMHWSQLTILLPSNGALFSHGRQAETDPGRSLPHLWR